MEHYAADFVVTDRQTGGQNDYRNRMHRGLKIMCGLLNHPPCMHIA